MSTESTTLTPGDVTKEVERIRSAADDPEIAHSLEDRLYARLLKAIADGTCVDAAECARIALTTGDIDFPRWFA